MKASILLLALVLTGCTTSPVKVEPVKVSWPDPIVPYEANWRVSGDVNKQVQMPLTEFQDFVIWQSDVLRYIKGLKTMVCFHQPDEIKCKSSVQP